MYQHQKDCYNLKKKSIFKKLQLQFSFFNNFDLKKNVEQTIRIFRLKNICRDLENDSIIGMNLNRDKFNLYFFIITSTRIFSRLGRHSLSCPLWLFYGLDLVENHYCLTDFSSLVEVAAYQGFGSYDQRAAAAAKAFIYIFSQKVSVHKKNNFNI